MSSCRATTRAGQPCRMTPQSGLAYCFTHNPENAAARAEIASYAGQRSGLSRRKVAVQPEALELSSPQSLNLFLRTLVAAELDGRIAPTRTRNILRILENMNDDALYNPFG